MKITTQHVASSFGRPVILNDSGEAMDQRSGLAMVKNKLGLNYSELGELTGVSRRTFEGWAYGKQIPTNALIVLQALLKERGEEWVM